MDKARDSGENGHQSSEPIALSLVGLLRDGEGLEQFFRKHHGPLAELDLRYNGLGASDARMLTAAVSLHPLRRLTLEYNALGDAGCKALAPVLLLPTMRQLDIGHNSVGVVGCEAMASYAALRGCTLRRLDLCHNCVGDAGTAALCRAMRANATLTQLNLDGNAVGDEGALMLAGALGSLWKLSVRENLITAAALHVLVDAAAESSCLQHLDMSYNLVFQQAAVELVRAFRARRRRTLLAVRSLVSA